MIAKATDVALRAFQAIGLPLERILDIETTWWKLRKDKNLENDNRDTFKAFQKHFNKQLRLLHVRAGNVQMKNAYQAAEVTRDGITQMRVPPWHWPLPDQSCFL